jgi:hypothetical protein
MAVPGFSLLTACSSVVGCIPPRAVEGGARRAARVAGDSLEALFLLLVVYMLLLTCATALDNEDRVEASHRPSSTEHDKLPMLPPVLAAPAALRLLTLTQLTPP